MTMLSASNDPRDAPDIDALRSVMGSFRDQYAIRFVPTEKKTLNKKNTQKKIYIEVRSDATAVDAAAERLDGDWDVLWTYATRNAVEDLLKPEADVSAIRGRLAYRESHRCLTEMVVCVCGSPGRWHFSDGGAARCLTLSVCMRDRCMFRRLSTRGWLASRSSPGGPYGSDDINMDAPVFGVTTTVCQTL